MGFIGDMLTKHREAILYVVCGGFTTLVSWGSYAVFEWCGLDLNLSNILSWVCGVLFAFVVNKWIVFESRSTAKGTIAREISLFFGARIVTGVIAILLFPALIAVFDATGIDDSLFGTDGMVVRIITSIIEIVLNYVFSKYMVFTHAHES